MKFIHVKAYIGNGNYRHHFLKVDLISAVNIYGNTKILEIIHNGKGFTFSLKDGKASGVISELKQLSIIPADFDLLKINLNEEQLRERLSILENASRK